MSKQRISLMNQFGLIALLPALVGVLYVILCTTSALGQVMVRPGPPKVIDALMQAEIIDSVSASLNDTYVFPDVAKAMEKHIRKQYRDQAYKNLTDLLAFTQQLTQDLQSISKDRHLTLMYLTADAPGVQSPDSLSDEDRLRQEEMAAATNYGFKKVEHLAGNVGYLKFDEFMPADIAGATAIAAMKFLGHSEALIIDLRDNSGGRTDMIQLVLSYFFKESVHLNSIYVRKTNSTEQYWTASYVEGPRLTEPDIYVLTSGFTASAAEEFAYDLKSLKRATIIGETTSGRAHTVEQMLYTNLNLTAFIPNGRAINPITGTDWEGTGVKPDIETPRDKAFNVAYLEALKKLSDKTNDPAKKAALNWTLDGVAADANPITVGPDALKQFVGAYGSRMITLEDGALYCQREGRPKYRLIPMSAEMFALEGLDIIRFRFVRDNSGNVTELIAMYNDGRNEPTPRNR